MIAALLVKEDFVLMTARNKAASGAMIDWTAPERPRARPKASIVACCAAANVDVRGGGRGSVAANVLETACPPWIVYGHDGRGQDAHFRRRQRPAGCRALHVRQGATRRVARSRDETRRSLYGRHFRRRTRLDCRRAGAPVRAGTVCFANLGPAAAAHALSVPPLAAVQSAIPRPPQRRPSLRPRRQAVPAVPRRRRAV